MAATTTTGQEIYSNEIFKKLVPQLAPLKGFSTDFSQEAKAAGEAVSVQLVEPDEVSTFGASNNFKRGASTNKKISVTFGEADITGFAVTPYQLANFNPGWWKQKAALNAATMARAYLKKVSDIVTAANFTNVKAIAKSTTITLAEIATIKSAAARKGINPRIASLYLCPEIFTALENLYNTTKTGLTLAQVQSELAAACGVAGVYSLDTIAAATAAGDLVGFISAPNAIAYAGRNFRPASDKPYEAVREIVDPETGIGMTTVEYVDGDMGNLNVSVTALASAEVGVADSLMRITATAV